MNILTAPKLVRAVLLQIGAVAILAAQGSTVVWKASLADLQRRLPGLGMNTSTAGYPELGRNWFLNFRYRFYR
jgi:ABC-type phosphate transport system auxiliary subunit